MYFQAVVVLSLLVKMLQRSLGLKGKGRGEGEGLPEI